MSDPWTRCNLAGLGLAAGEVPVQAVSERVAATGWIAPYQTRPMRLLMRVRVAGSNKTTEFQ